MMDVETIEKLRDLAADLAHPSCVFWRDEDGGVFWRDEDVADMGRRVLALLPPEAAPGPYRAVRQCDGRWKIVSAEDAILAAVADEPTAKLLAESPTEAKAARKLLTEIRHWLRKPLPGLDQCAIGDEINAHLSEYPA